MQELRLLPDNQNMFKCYSCRSIFDIYGGGMQVMMPLIPKDSIRCPLCGKYTTKLMCKVDRFSIGLKLKGFKCREGTMMSGFALCPDCNEPMCPRCYNHDTVSVSRVTGYLQDISGWNMSKRQELLDRKRYNISDMV